MKKTSPVLLAALTVLSVHRGKFGRQRRLGDRIDFATALPEGGEAWKK